LQSGGAARAFQFKRLTGFFALFGETTFMIAVQDTDAVRGSLAAGADNDRTAKVLPARLLLRCISVLFSLSSAECSFSIDECCQQRPQ